LINPSIIRFDDLVGLVVAADTLDTVFIGDIIDIYGPRLPSHEDTPKAYRMATVVVSDRPLTPVELTYHDRQAEWFGSDNDNIHAFAAATGFRASMDTRLPPSITAVLDDAVAIAPGLPGTSPELEQNYPNPFNSSTVIRFALPTSQDVELAIYNLAGQKVATLVDGTRQAATYTVRWDGRDVSGHDLASGVYLYRLRAGGEQVQTRKLVLIR